MNSSPTPTVRCFATHAPDATGAFGEALATQLGNGDLLVLTGDLGAGKTRLTQGIGIGLGITDRITSPTFTIASRYEGRIVLNHLDVYRIDQIEETLDLDLPELLESGATVIEWGEQIDPALPSDRLVVRLAYGDGDDDRLIRFEANEAGWIDRLDDLAAALADWSVEC